MEIIHQANICHRLVTRPSSCSCAMDADERDVCNYLKSFPGQYVSFREISRRAGGKRRYRLEPEWAVPVVARMVERGVIESDSTGHYRFKSRPKRERQSRWVSPQIKKILEASGKDLDGVFEVDAEDPDDVTQD